MVEFTSLAAKRSNCVANDWQLDPFTSQLMSFGVRGGIRSTVVARWTTDQQVE